MGDRDRLERLIGIAGMLTHSLRSRPIVRRGRPLLRRECQDPARPDPPRQAATALGAPRVPATKTRQPSPASGSLRRSSHFGSRSAPSRAALLAWLTAASSWAFPLDRALCGRPAASVAERTLRDRSTLLTAHINSVWIRQREFAS